MSLNPHDFVITRKRKKYKFAHFANFANCFEVEGWKGFNLSDVNKPITIELGAGTGLFALELARRHPERFYVAIDVKADRLYTAARTALDEELDNLVFLRAHADKLLDLFAPQSIDEFWLTFSDPFPKKRHIKHRLTHPRFLEAYRQLLTAEGVLRQKTDNHALFDWGLEQLVADGWQLKELSYDLHESRLPEDYKIQTSFESRFLAEGLPIYFVAATR